MKILQLMWIIFCVLALLTLYFFRRRREGKARKLLAAPDSVKLYFSEGKAWNFSESLWIASVNSQKPLVAKDSGGNYIVIQAGDNAIVAQHIYAMRSVQHEECVQLCAESGMMYGVYFDQENSRFFVKTGVMRYQYGWR